MTTLVPAWYAAAVEAVLRTVDALPWCPCGRRAVAGYVCDDCGHARGQPNAYCKRCGVVGALRRRLSCVWCGAITWPQGPPPVREAV